MEPNQSESVPVGAKLFGVQSRLELVQFKVRVVGVDAGGLAKARGVSAGGSRGVGCFLFTRMYKYKLSWLVNF